MTYDKPTKQEYRAILREFNTTYGVDESKLEGWQRLCEDCDVEPGPSITQCKKVLRDSVSAGQRWCSVCQTSTNPPTSNETDPKDRQHQHLRHGLQEADQRASVPSSQSAGFDRVYTRAWDDFSQGAGEGEWVFEGVACESVLRFVGSFGGVVAVVVRACGSKTVGA